MGLWDSYVPNGEGDGDRGLETAPACSICFDTVTAGGGRSTAKLQCGHEFHLDCIGSAFNAKGMMQCPNCRNIEKGNWLNGNGFCLLPTFNLDEWTYDDDIYNINYLEMPYGVHWCPVNRIGRVTSSFVNGESFPPDAFQDLVGHQVIFTELPSSSVFASTFHASSDGPSNTIYYHLWGQFVDPSQVPSPLSLPTSGVHFHVWDHYPSTYSHHSGMASASIQASALHTTTHGTRLDDGGPPMAGSLFYSFIDRPHFLPLLPDLSSNRARNIPGEHSTSYSDPHRSGNIRNHLPFAGPTTWSSPVLSGSYIYPPPVTIYSDNVGDMMSTGDQFQTSQGVQFIPTGSVESGSQSGFWHGHPSEMLSAQARTETWPNGSVRVRRYL